MRILVIDAQGGGIGCKLIEALKAQPLSQSKIIAVGTNALATNAMLKSGADGAATGENAVLYNAQNCDIIMGPVGIIAANSMFGEISPAMATAISGSPAQKVLIPAGKCHVAIAGVKEDSIANYIKEAAELVVSVCQK